ncbi:MAG: TonB-dependent receptor, partial [Hyphomonadaceae bacterium]|nr:TonB-dependent receptor [Hyphomonadaceae bacterium]
MKKGRTVTRKTQRRACASILAVATALAATPFAMAQNETSAEPIETGDPAEGDATMIPGDVVVTGTRIRGLAEDGAIQAFSIDRSVIDETGAGSLIEVLKDLPQTGGGRGTFS